MKEVVFQAEKNYFYSKDNEQTLQSTIPFSHTWNFNATSESGGRWQVQSLNYTNRRWIQGNLAFVPQKLNGEKSSPSKCPDLPFLTAAFILDLFSLSKLFHLCFDHQAAPLTCYKTISSTWTNSERDLPLPFWSNPKLFLNICNKMLKSTLTIFWNLLQSSGSSSNRGQEKAISIRTTTWEWRFLFCLLYCLLLIFGRIPPSPKKKRKTHLCLGQGGVNKR